MVLLLRWRVRRSMRDRIDPSASGANWTRCARASRTRRRTSSVRRSSGVIAGAPSCAAVPPGPARCDSSRHPCSRPSPRPSGPRRGPGSSAGPAPPAAGPAGVRTAVSTSAYVSCRPPRSRRSAAVSSARSAGAGTGPRRRGGAAPTGHRFTTVCRRYAAPRVRVAQPVPPGVQSDERVLDDLLGLARVVQQQRGQTHQRTVLGGEQGRDRLVRRPRRRAGRSPAERYATVLPPRTLRCSARQLHRVRRRAGCHANLTRNPTTGLPRRM